jgi:uncharacterized protein YkwD
MRIPIVAMALAFLDPCLAASEPVDREAATREVRRAGEPIAATPLAYPSDPTDDIPWSAGYAGVDDIQVAFNAARAAENAQLGSSIPMMSLPTQAQWDAMSNAERALWLSDRERIDRGVAPMHGVEANVQSVAAYYAGYLLDNNAMGHTADGSDPWQRLDTNPAIGACHDFLNVAENLAYFWTSGSSIALPVERAVYMWMYEDSGSSWGHRHAVLWYPYDDNSGPAGREGFYGLGRASGGPHQGWPFAEIIVMNVFDPCASWVYAPEPIFSDGFETGDTAAWSATVP